MNNLLLTIHFLITIALIGIILIQKSEGGGSLLGGSGGGNMFTARGAANLLTQNYGNFSGTIHLEIVF